MLLTTTLVGVRGMYRLTNLPALLEAILPELTAQLAATTRSAAQVDAKKAGAPHHRPSMLNHRAAAAAAAAAADVPCVQGWRGRLVLECDGQRAALAADGHGGLAVEPRCLPADAGTDISLGGPTHLVTKLLVGAATAGLLALDDAVTITWPVEAAAAAEVTHRHSLEPSNKLEPFPHASAHHRSLWRGSCQIVGWSSGPGGPTRSNRVSRDVS